MTVFCRFNDKIGGFPRSGEAGARRQIEAACGKVFGHRQRRHRLILVHRQMVQGCPERPAAISGGIERLQQLRTPVRIGRVEVERVQPKITGAPGRLIDEAYATQTGERFAPTGRRRSSSFSTPTTPITRRNCRR